MTLAESSIYTDGMIPLAAVSLDKLPTKGILSFMYMRGYRDDGTKHWHRGIDFPAPKGTPIFAAAGGTVTQANSVWEQGFGGYGKNVVIHGDNGFYYLYGHLDEVLVNVGDRVGMGHLIGKVGYTAFSNDKKTNDLESRGAHLHFEVSETKYPQSAEAPRVDPVAHLAWLAAPYAGAGVVLILAGLGIWLFVRKRHQ